jgi:hypothetical protein
MTSRKLRRHHSILQYSLSEVFTCVSHERKLKIAHMEGKKPIDTNGSPEISTRVQFHRHCVGDVPEADMSQCICDEIHLLNIKLYLRNHASRNSCNCVAPYTVNLQDHRLKKDNISKRIRINESHNPFSRRTKITSTLETRALKGSPWCI